MRGVHVDACKPSKLGKPSSSLRSSGGILEQHPLQAYQRSISNHLLKRKPVEKETQLTDRVDVKKLNWGLQDGVEHAVVEILSRVHKDVEEEQTTKESKYNRSSC